MNDEALSEEDVKMLKQQLNAFKKLEKIVQGSGGKLPPSLIAAGKKLGASTRSKPKADEAATALQHELRHFAEGIADVKAKLGKKGAHVKAGDVAFDKAGKAVACEKNEEIKLKKGGSIGVKKGKNRDDALKTIKDVSTTENDLRNMLSMPNRTGY